MFTNNNLPLDELESIGIDVRSVIGKLKAQQVETPSWGYGNSGTRFNVFQDKGAARNIWEKIEDAALVNKLTGVSPSIAIHIPWDKVNDYKALIDYAKDRGMRIGAVNPNLFQDEDYKLGSITHANPNIRKKAFDHLQECVDVIHEVGSNLLSFWLADGTNYPGQDSIRLRKNRMEDVLEKVYKMLPKHVGLLIEYKFFEPAFYLTDIPDWGFSYSLCSKLGPQAKVLVDIGHHAHGTNIEQIIAFLIDENRLGGIHFNDRKYADDDLISGSINPLELFLIFHEIVDAEKDKYGKESAQSIAFMIDQNFNIERKVEGMIQTIINIQTAYAKALIVNSEALRRAQEQGDILAANRELMHAFETDVRPLLSVMREELGIDPDPIRAYRDSGHAERTAKERGLS